MTVIAGTARDGAPPPGWYDEWNAQFRAECRGIAGLGTMTDRDLENLCRFDADRLLWDANAKPRPERLPRRMMVRRGARLIHAGARDNAAYLILSGEFDVTDADEVGAVARRLPGEWIGEQAALMNIPRSANADAVVDAEVLRVPASTLRPIYRRLIGRSLKPEVNARAIEIALRHQADLRTLGPAERARLAARATLVELRDGRVLFREGDAPDFVYVVRSGRVLVEAARASERAVEVLGPLSLVGEFAVVRRVVRSATIRGDGDCELVAIPAAEFAAAMECDEAFASRMTARCDARMAATGAGGSGEHLRRQGLSMRLAEGGSTPRERRAIDPLRCIRCRMCEDACAETHGGVARLTIDEPVVAGVRDSGACSNCELAYCEMACNYTAISRGMDGQVEIDPALCVGCKACATPGTGCPYGSIQVVESQSLRPPASPSVYRALQRSFLSFWYGLPIPRPSQDAEPEGRVVSGGAGTRVGAHGVPVAAACDKSHKALPRGVAVKCDLCRGLGGREQCIAACPVDAIRIDALTGGLADG